MSQPPLTCSRDQSLADAARLMWERDCGAIVVTDEDERVVGVITDRDICMAAYTRGLAPQSLRIAEAMANQVYSCHVHDTPETVQGLMAQMQIRRVPVVDGDNRVVGVVSLNDLARDVAARKKNGSHRELVQTLAAICAARPRQADAEQPRLAV